MELPGCLCLKGTFSIPKISLIIFKTYMILKLKFDSNVYYYFGECNKHIKTYFDLYTNMNVEVCNSTGNNK